ncbi:hypothetical protein NLJ89_g7515 [Agrocybe chaxingu]|uniref:Uncharacterized protein n=1 Tax=Agrocybe chaxingu TaxID=84603 RepID=A0A9W8JZ20_9AGAR|nr:hypothetical protein NLJ89_g7515 [Agrocybe chaxingu]
MVVDDEDSGDDVVEIQQILHMTRFIPKHHGSSRLATVGFPSDEKNTPKAKAPACAFDEVSFATPLNAQGHRRVEMAPRVLLCNVFDFQGDEQALCTHIEDLKASAKKATVGS